VTAFKFRGAGPLLCNHFRLHRDGAHAPEEGVFDALAVTVVAEELAVHMDAEEMFSQVAEGFLVERRDAEAGGADEVVEDFEAIEDDALGIFVLVVDEIHSLSDVAKEFERFGRSAEVLHGGIGDFEGLGGEVRVQEEDDAIADGGEGAFVVAAEGEDGIKLGAFGLGIDTEAYKGEVFRTLGVQYRKVTHAETGQLS